MPGHCRSCRCQHSLPFLESRPEPRSSRRLCCIRPGFITSPLCWPCWRSCRGLSQVACLGLIAGPKKAARELTVNQSAQLTGNTADDGFQKQKAAGTVDGQMIQTDHNRERTIPAISSSVSTTGLVFMLLPREPETILPILEFRTEYAPSEFTTDVLCFPKRDAEVHKHRRHQDQDDRSPSSLHDHLNSGRQPATIPAHAETRTTLKNRA